MEDRCTEASFDSLMISWDLETIPTNSVQLRFLDSVIFSYSSSS